MDPRLSGLEHSRREREKELDGLYRLAVLFSRNTGGVGGILQGTAEIIRESMQYSAAAGVLVSAGETSGAAGPRDVGKVADSYRAEYAYGEGGRVSLLVTYAGSAERPNVDMVIEEREKRLIDSAVSLLGNVLLRLETTEAKVEQARELERKNIALREVLHEIEHDREALVNNAMAYIDSVVMPFIHELRHSPGLRDADRAITVHLSRALRDLFETDPVRIMRLFKDLTPRETEIAGLIRSGMTTKEIGEVLHIAATTVERHRNTIRRKLGLRGRDANLTTYLRFPG